MGEDDATTLPPPPPAGCDFCDATPAVVYCPADSARLCLACDRHVHAANSVSSRHHRSLLCDACRSAPASFLSSSLILCSNCDFDAAGSDPHRHRRPLDPFSGSPSVLHLAALLGLPDNKPLAECDNNNHDHMWAWEPAPVFSLEDLIVPTTSNHGFRAIVETPPLLPKDRNAGCGRYREEILRQLNELIKSEDGAAGNDGGDEPELDYLVSEHHGCFQQGGFESEFNKEQADIGVPSLEASALRRNHSDFTETTDSVVFSYEQLMGIPSMVNAPFPDVQTDVHSNTSHANVGEVDVQYSAIEEKIPSFPTKGGSEFCADRNSVISRYKEKRKTRRYDKLIRYESRKARADSRVRIKGRFAKMNQVTDS